MAKKIVSITGVRPETIKIAPLARALDGIVTHKIVHTGQHYSYDMDGVFFRELGMLEPDYNVGAGSGSHGAQTGRMLIGLEEILIKERPDAVVVAGDTNSTLAGALAAAKLGIPVAHIEAGLRSYDREMPEETNRILVDQISGYLFTHSRSADDNLLREGIGRSKIYFVGNIMIDSLVYNRDKFIKAEGDYAVLTLHRPSNVDGKEKLSGLLGAFGEISKDIRIIFPAHPRTAKMMRSYGLNSVEAIPPMGYNEFMGLMAGAKFVMTDSGGIQEETTYFGIPCLTLRDNTERPITVEAGTNIIVGTEARDIIREAKNIMAGKFKAGQTPELWDGKTAERIAKILT